jgi:hypothetical protein
MRRRKAHEGLDFEALRYAIEHCDLDAMLVFYSKEVRLSIVNADAPQALPFELRGKAEIAKHLRVVFGQKTSHRVERGVADENRMMFRDASEYPDGGRVVVETKLEVREGKIVRQVDVVASDARANSQEGIGRGPPT